MTYAQAFMAAAYKLAGRRPRTRDGFEEPAWPVPDLFEVEREAHEAQRKALLSGVPLVVGDRVRKTRGSSWQGRVCGFYSTELTPNGICVESEREPGSVQIYSASALEAAPPAEQDTNHGGGR